MLAVDLEAMWAMPGFEVPHEHDSQVSAPQSCHPFTPATTYILITLSAGSGILSASSNPYIFPED